MEIYKFYRFTKLRKTVQQSLARTKGWKLQFKAAEFRARHFSERSVASQVKATEFDLKRKIMLGNTAIGNEIHKFFPSRHLYFKLGFLDY